MKIQTVLTKNIGHAVPVELLELILASKPDVFGFAVQCTDEKGNPELSVTHDGGKPTLQDLKDFQHNAQDFRALIAFGKFGEGYNKEDILPFILNDGEDKPFMAIGMEGDFPKYDVTESGRTQEYNLASGIIIPSLLDICELTEGDLAKIVSALGRDSFNNNFVAQIGHRGIMTLLPVEGDFISFGKNELGEVYDWGSTSQRHTFGDVKQEPVKIEAPVVKKRFSFGAKKIETETVGKVVTTNVETAVTTVKDAATAGTAARTSVPVVEAKDKKPAAERPPSWVHKNDDVKSWYKMVGGAVPQNWKKRLPVIPVEGALIPKDLVELHKFNAEALKTTLVQLPVKTETAAPAPKVEAAAPTAAPKTGADIKAARAEDNLPIINATEMEKILDFVAKHLDGQSNVMPKPSEIQAMEKKFPSFSESLGIKPHEMLNWPVAGLFALAKTDPRAIVLMAIEMRNLWRNTLKAEDLVNTATTTEVVTTTVTKTGDTVKVESISNAPAPAAKKKGFWSKAA